MEVVGFSVAKESLETDDCKLGFAVAADFIRLLRPSASLSLADLLSSRLRRLLLSSKNGKDVLTSSEQLG